jgi:hypothetical protein
MLPLSCPRVFSAIEKNKPPASRKQAEKAPEIQIAPVPNQAAGSKNNATSSYAAPGSGILGRNPTPKKLANQVLQIQLFVQITCL